MDQTAIDESGAIPVVPTVGITSAGSDPNASLAAQQAAQQAASQPNQEVADIATNLAKIRAGLEKIFQSPIAQHSEFNNPAYDKLASQLTAQSVGDNVVLTDKTHGHQFVVTETSITHVDPDKILTAEEVEQWFLIAAQHPQMMKDGIDISGGSPADRALIQKMFTETLPAKYGFAGPKVNNPEKFSPSIQGTVARKVAAFHRGETQPQPQTQAEAQTPEKGPLPDAIDGSVTASLTQEGEAPDTSLFGDGSSTPVLPQEKIETQKINALVDANYDDLKKYVLGEKSATNETLNQFFAPQEGITNTNINDVVKAAGTRLAEKESFVRKEEIFGGARTKRVVDLSGNFEDAAKPLFLTPVQKISPLQQSIETAINEPQHADVKYVEIEAAPEQIAEGTLSVEQHADDPSRLTLYINKEEMDAASDILTALYGETSDTPEFDSVLKKLNDSIDHGADNTDTPPNTEISQEVTNVTGPAEADEFVFALTTEPQAFEEEDENFLESPELGSGLKTAVEEARKRIKIDPRIAKAAQLGKHEVEPCSTNFMPCASTGDTAPTNEVTPKGADRLAAALQITRQAPPSA